MNRDTDAARAPRFQRAVRNVRQVLDVGRGDRGQQAGRRNLSDEAAIDEVEAGILFLLCGAGQLRYRLLVVLTMKIEGYLDGITLVLFLERGDQRFLPEILDVGAAADEDVECLGGPLGGRRRRTLRASCERYCCHRNHRHGYGFQETMPIHCCPPVPGRSNPGWATIIGAITSRNIVGCQLEAGTIATLLEPNDKLAKGQEKTRFASNDAELSELSINQRDLE